jgi:chemotaxis protein MotA
MNFSSIIGLLLAFGVALGAALTSTKNWKIFLDPHAALIVLGGTGAVALLSFSAKKIIVLCGVFFKRVLKRSDELFVAVEEIVSLAKGYRENDNHLKESLAKIKTHFLKEAIEMIVNGGMESEELDKILQKRAQNMKARHDEDAEIFKTLSKFPPAFGLMGAVIGMISMMQNMGGPDGFSKVGPSLAVALVATLYGIAVANFFFLPIGEYLVKLNRLDHFIRLMIIDCVKLIRLKKHPIVVEETAMSYLIPTERLVRRGSKKPKVAA